MTPIPVTVVQPGEGEYVGLLGDAEDIVAGQRTRQRW